MSDAHTRGLRAAAEHDAELRHALQAFHLTRQLALLLVVGAGAAMYHARSLPGRNLVAAGLLALGGAVLVALHARGQLLARLVELQVRRGADRARALFEAQVVLASLLRQPHQGEGTTLDLTIEEAMQLPDITITRLDLERLSSLLDAAAATHAETADLLDRELARAQIVPSRAVPADVVTMNSRLCFEDAGVAREITLVYPSDADAELSRVSVLSPVGCALLGLRVGQTIEWPFSNGQRKRYRVLSVSYQPEAAGHFHL